MILDGSVTRNAVAVTDEVELKRAREARVGPQTDVIRSQ